MADLLKRDRGRNVWQARLDIPARVQHAFLNAKGQPKRTLVKSLGTADKVEAKKRAALVISRWRRLFEKAGLGDDPLREEAERWRAWIASTSTGDEDDITPTLLGERAEEIERQHGEKTAQLFYRAATGKAVFLDAVADRWLAWRAYPPRAEQAHRYHLKLLTERHQEVSQVDRKAASRFVAEVLIPGRDASTIAKTLSSYTQLWKWMKREEIVEGDSPWIDQAPPARANLKGARSALGGDRRRPFTEAEASLFLAALRGVDREVVQLLAVTGLRLEESASLLVGDVEDTEGATWIRITAGKTAAARRRIPVVVAEVRSMLRERCSASSDGAVFHELPADRNGDRSRALTKRLGWALREKLRITDRSLVAAHGWRHRARTKLEAASISPWTADFFLGHMRYGEGLGRYSKPSDEQLMAAAKVVPLPAGS